MSTIVTATIPTDQFALADTLEASPDAAFESVSSVAQGRSDMPLVRGSARDVELLTAEMMADPTTDDVEVLSGRDGARLYRVTWHPPTRALLSVLSETGGTVLDAYGTRDGWDVRLLFPERDAAGAAQDVCEEYDIDMTIRSVGVLSCDRPRQPPDLTEEQSDALLSALEVGYFDVPRETDLQELASRFDISHQALSERLRRGQRALVAGSLTARTAAGRAGQGPEWRPGAAGDESTP